MELVQEQIDGLNLDVWVSFILKDAKHLPVIEKPDELPPNSGIEEVLLDFNQIQCKEYLLALEIMNHAAKVKTETGADNFTGLFLYLEKGAKVFADSLYRKVMLYTKHPDFEGINFEIDSMRVSSYESNPSDAAGTMSSAGHLKIHSPPRKDLQDIDLVFILDDIGDTRLTCYALKPIVSDMYKCPARTVVLLNKIGTARYDVPLDFIGFDIKNRYVVGYGLDSTSYQYDANGNPISKIEYCRGLKNVVVLKQLEEEPVKEPTS